MTPKVQRVRREGRGGERRGEPVPKQVLGWSLRHYQEFVRTTPFPTGHGGSHVPTDKKSRQLWPELYHVEGSQTGYATWLPKSNGSEDWVWSHCSTCMYKVNFAVYVELFHLWPPDPVAHLKLQAALSWNGAVSNAEHNRNSHVTPPSNHVSECSVQYGNGTRSGKMAVLITHIRSTYIRTYTFNWIVWPWHDWVSDASTSSVYDWKHPLYMYLCMHIHLLYNALNLLYCYNNDKGRAAQSVEWCHVTFVEMSFWHLNRTLYIISLKHFNWKICIKSR